MRLGLRRSIIKEGTIASKLYKGAKFVDERHRHRYEVNPKMIADIEKAGLIFSAHDIKKERMEMIELKDHKFFVGCQFHPVCMHFRTHILAIVFGFCMYKSACEKVSTRTVRELL